MDETEKTDIIQRLKAVVISITPDAAFVQKYGGLVVESGPGQSKTQFCGFFAYKSHVSLELTNGALLDDPDKFLEGCGKYRRHIKLFSLADVVEKRCENFLCQAHRLQATVI